MGDKMDIRNVLKEYDSLFNKKSLNEIQQFLMDKINEAEAEGDINSQVTLLNEIIGLCRNTFDQVVARDSIDKVLKLMEELNLSSSEQYVITLINIATTLRVFKDYKASMSYYTKAKELLDNHQNVKPYTLSSFHNNLGLLYFEMGEFTTAKEHFMKAVTLLSGDESAKKQLKISADHIKLVDIMLKETYIEKSKAFYEAFGKEMIEKAFPEYVDRIAVGIVGEGSEKFGFEDAVSNDHDLIIGFCMWLTDEDYSKIGWQLNQLYNMLPKLSVSGMINNSYGNERLGAFPINNFYYHILRIRDVKDKNVIDDNFWRTIDEALLATATNGQVFVDKLGEFTNFRNTLKNHYPKPIMREKLATLLHEFSQTAQYNYPRSMVRKDYVTALVCKGKAYESLMKILYLLEGEFAPYYKWLKKGLEKYIECEPILDILEEIPKYDFQPEVYGDCYDPSKVYLEDKTVAAFEEISRLLLLLLRKKKFVYGESSFLDAYCMDIMKLNEIDEIVDLEWEQFDKVKNEGGRANCQDNFKTFSIMRKSQFMAWPTGIIRSYHNDIIKAKKEKRNLLEEKYGRMMESTAPEQYENIKHHFPVLSDERRAKQERIIMIQVKMMEDYANKYPNLSGNARNIHTSEDTAYCTSYETYLRGELGTYSDTTLGLYEDFIQSVKHSGKNLAYMVMCNTTMNYGYASIDEAEKNTL